MAQEDPNVTFFVCVVAESEKVIKNIQKTKHKGKV